MKFSRYNIIIEENNEVIMYNSKNASFVKISREKDINELKRLLETKDLSVKNPIVQAFYKCGYIVDDDIDEYVQVKEKIKKIYEDWASTLFLMIYTTEQCNFRCIYCSEKHTEQRLSDKNWEYVYNFIKKKTDSSDIKRVIINFFGGEPLLEVKKIIEFLEKLKNLKKENKELIFENRITTNAYLLTPKIYDTLIDLNLTNYQITVDGFAKTHDKMRPRADGEPTWDKIIENLKYINSKKDKATIFLRTNFNSINEDTVVDFTKWGEKTFNNQKFIFNSTPVSKFSDNVEDSLLADCKTKSSKDIINKQGIDVRSDIKFLNPLRNLGWACKCAAKNFYSIKVDGTISKCEQACIGTFNIGYLDPDEGAHFDVDMSVWEDGFEIEECKNCYIYPLCAARKCPVKKVFDPKRKDCLLNCLEDGMTVEQVIIDSIKTGVLNTKGSKVIKKVK